MAIVGFRVHSVLGWILGTVFVDKPWGPPTYKTWKSLHTFWCLAVLIIQQTLFLDFLRLSNNYSHLEINRLAHYLHTIMFVASYLTYLIVKVVFFVYAKDLASLLGSLYHYQVITKDHFCWKSTWNKFRFVVSISTVSVFASSTLFMIEIQSGLLGSSILSFAGWLGQLIVGFFFACLATITAANISFVLISTITFHLGRIYCNFCHHLENQFNCENFEIVLFEKEFLALKADPKHLFSMTSSTAKEFGTLKRFEEIEQLFKKADKILSPLTFVVIVSGTFRVITAAHEILLNTKLTTALLLSNYMVVLENMVQTVSLVLIGQYVKDMMNGNKSALRRQLILMPNRKLTDDPFRNLVKWVIEFEWSLSGWKFFYVDRRLLSGIVATAMSYIVILVQLQISLNSPLELDRFNRTFNL